MALTYAVAEKVMIAWLKSAFPTVHPCTETWDGFEKFLPVVKVSRVGDALSQISLDGARLDLEVFHSTADGALTLGSQIRAALETHAPGFTAQGAVIASVLVGGPVWTPYDNTNLRRVELHPAVTFHNQ